MDDASPVMWWWPLVLVAVVGVMMGATQLRVDPLDDPDPAHQRPGLLDLDSLPAPAPILPDLEYHGGPTLFVFARESQPPCSWLDALEIARAAVVLAIGAPEGAAGRAGCPGLQGVADPWGLAREVGMRTPRDGGFPVGYAIVDADGLLRYRTLDPDMAHLVDEINTMIEAVRNA